MARLAHGPASRRVLCSLGPSPSTLHFYSTTYSCNHGRVEARPGLTEARHRGTGYVANFRPALYYSRSLDRADNRHMLELLADNYESLSASDFLWHQAGCSTHGVNSTTHSALSGTHGCRNGTHISPSGSSGIHSGAGSGSMHTSQSSHAPSTEYKTNYTRHTSWHQGKNKTARIEDSGFTHNQNIEPVTFRPPEAFSSSLPFHLTWRPTGCSITSAEFIIPTMLTGREKLMALSARADSSSGYVKGSKFISDVQQNGLQMTGHSLSAPLDHRSLSRLRRRDPAEHSTITHPHQFLSSTTWSMETGRQAHEDTVHDGRREVGRKEMSGFSENTPPMGLTNVASNQYCTEYEHNHGSKVSHLQRPVVVNGRPVQPSSSGFTRGTQVHKFAEPHMDNVAVLRQLNPTVARMTLQSSPFLEDPYR